MSNFQSNFPHLQKLMAGYLNEDAFEITGCRELKGMVEYYTTRVSEKSMKELLVEIDVYIESTKMIEDAKFEDIFDFGFRIVDEDAFFETVKAVVRNKLKE